MKEHHILHLDGRYSTGIESIDEQHTQLISMCNNLYLDHQKKGEFSRDFFRQCLSSVVNFLQYHFFVEEQLLSRIAYPEFRDHQEEHKQAADFLNRCLVYLDAGEEAWLRESVPLLRGRLLKHITVSDRRYASYIHAMNRHSPRYSKESRLPTEVFLN